MRRFYFVVKYLSPKASPSLLAGRCIKALHQVSTRAGKRVGVTFPEWSGLSLGPSIGFVASELASLSLVREQPYFRSMTEAGVFAVSEITEVPDGAKEVRFIRNQRVAKLFPKEYQRRYVRACKRAQERGERFMPENLKQSFEVEAFHRASMESKANGSGFILHIQLEEADSPQEGYSSYGLASPCEHRGTVPLLMTE